MHSVWRVPSYEGTYAGRTVCPVSAIYCKCTETTSLPYSLALRGTGMILERANGNFQFSQKLQTLHFRHSSVSSAAKCSADKGGWRSLPFPIVSLDWLNIHFIFSKRIQAKKAFLRALSTRCRFYKLHYQLLSNRSLQSLQVFVKLSLGIPNNQKSSSFCPPNSCWLV